MWEKVYIGPIHKSLEKILVWTQGWVWVSIAQINVNPPRAYHLVWQEQFTASFKLNFEFRSAPAQEERNKINKTNNKPLVEKKKKNLLKSQFEFGIKKI